MAKRKHDESSSSSEETEGEATHRKLRKVIAHGVAQMSSALEQARRFERQKLGKRQHDKSRSDTEGRRINVEIAVLKSLDMSVIATQRLHKNLVKTTSIAKTGMLPGEVKLPPPANMDKSTADLMARLFKQKAVGEAMDTTMTNVRQVLGLQANGASKRQKIVAMNLEDRDHASVDSVLPVSTATKVLPGNAKRGKLETQQEGSESDSEDEFVGFESRLASSSEDEEEEEEEELSHADRLVSRPKDTDSVSISNSESEEEPAPKSSSRTISRPTTSAFLPSLSMGGYMSGSDSDATDIEEHVAPRKNRRGQRARQAIWEKKFKEQAKHLKEPPKGKNKDKRGEGWDAQRGAVGNEDRRGRFGGSKNTKGPSGGNAAPLGKDRSAKGTKVTEKAKHRDDDGALHPSWEAKKLAKQQSIGIGGFKGKKMTFD